jgi:hypothetical protein
MGRFRCFTLLANRSEMPREVRERRREKSMPTNSKPEGTLRATLCEIERGLFYAT